MANSNSYGTVVLAVNGKSLDVLNCEKAELIEFSRHVVQYRANELLKTTNFKLFKDESVPLAVQHAKIQENRLNQLEEVVNFLNRLAAQK